MDLKDIKEGIKIKFEKQVSSEDLRYYKLLTNDLNPIHYDEEFSKNTIFKKPIVPGIITFASSVGILADLYPGAIITKVNILFKAPVHLNENIKGVVEVTSFDKLKKKGTFRIKMVNSDKVVVLESELDCFFGAKIDDGS